MIDKQFLKDQANLIGISLDENQLSMFSTYAKLLVEWNEKINLTSILEPKDIVIKHFVDSLMLLKYLPKDTKNIIDVGTGAGFPGIPAKIVNQGLNVTLLDSLQKRVTFLSEVSNQINQNINCIHFRAEDAGQDANYREKFDVATARAVANLTNLCEFCLPFVKVGGYFISLKGFEIEEELDEAKKAIAILGGKIESVEKYQLSDESKRSIVIIKKISQTSTKYPRSFAKMKKQPIK